MPPLRGSEIDWPSYPGLTPWAKSCFALRAQSPRPGLSVLGLGSVSSACGLSLLARVFLETGPRFTELGSNQTASCLVSFLQGLYQAVYAAAQFGNVHGGEAQQQAASPAGAGIAAQGHNFHLVLSGGSSGLLGAHFSF